MTMSVRITNESSGSTYEALVRVYDTTTNIDRDDMPFVAEDKAAARVLAVGASALVMVHQHRFITVEEVPPAVTAALVKAP